MALDASRLLGSPELAGVKVNPRGMAKKVTSGVEVGVSRLAAPILFGKSNPTPSETPKFGRNAYLAVTDSELALIKLKSGVVRLKLDEVVARVPRSEVASAELGGGVALPLTITFADGGSWQLEVPWPSKKHAHAVVQTLGGSQ